jgi:hypothetical protein
MWYSHKNRCIDQWCRIENLEIFSFIDDQINFTYGANTVQVGKEECIQQMLVAEATG